MDDEVVIGIAALAVLWWFYGMNGKKTQRKADGHGTARGSSCGCSGGKSSSIAAATTPSNPTSSVTTGLLAGKRKAGSGGKSNAIYSRYNPKPAPGASVNATSGTLTGATAPSGPSMSWGKGSWQANTTVTAVQ